MEARGGTARYDRGCWSNSFLKVSIPYKNTPTNTNIDTMSPTMKIPELCIAVTVSLRQQERPEGEDGRHPEADVNAV